MIYFDFLANGLITLFIVSSTWLIVVMAAERYIAVCHPLQARKLISLRRTRASVIIVFVICSLSTIPIFLERTIIEVNCNDGREVYKLVERSEIFVRLRRIMWATFYDFIPSAALVYFNLCLVIQIHKAKRLRDQMTPKQSVILYSSAGTKTSIHRLNPTRNVIFNNKHVTHTPILCTKKPRPSIDSINANCRTNRSSEGHDHKKRSTNDSSKYETSSNGTKNSSRGCFVPVSNKKDEERVALNEYRFEHAANGSSNLRIMISGNSSKKRASDTALNSVTATLVAVVLLFLLLVSPSELMKFSVSYTPADKDQKLIVTYVTNFMQVLNFSLNFVLYCAVNKTFRQTLHGLFCSCWLTVQE